MKRELIQVSPTVRVENGPVRKTAIATEELLSDEVTARHYRVGNRDAVGKPIVLGEEMTYLDYRGHWTWYIYREQEVQIPEEERRQILASEIRMATAAGSPTAPTLDDIPTTVRQYLPAGSDPDKDAALTAAAALEE